MARKFGQILILRDWRGAVGKSTVYKYNFAKRILKPEGTIWISGTYHSIYQCGFALQMEDFHLLNDIAWFKPNASPNLSCRFFTASHETLIWARKSKKAKHYFNYDLMKNGSWAEDMIKKPNLQMRSVWSIYPPKREEKVFGKHPTQKPIELLRRCILASTPENAIILDPFNGGGTTGIATEIVRNRKYIGIDLEQSYLDLTIQRYEEIKNKSLI
jgi:site-specific DNA-methyltransferase (adenine-specific)